MTTFRATIPESLEEWATEVFFQRYASKRPRNIFRQFMRVTTSNRAFEEAWEVSGLGTFALKPEGTPIAFDDPVQGNRTRISMLTFALGFRATMEAMDDDRWDIVERMPTDLADSADDHQERFAHGLLNDAFTGTSFLGLDGLSLVNAAHTSLKGGGARSNALVPGVALSSAGIEDILSLAKLMTDDSGRFLRFTPNHFIIHPNNEFEIARILESTQRPGTADNDINVLNRIGATWSSTPYLTDPDDWFVIDRENNDMRYFERKGVTARSSTDEDTLDMKFTSHYRAGVGFWMWMGVWGSNAP